MKITIKAEAAATINELVKFIDSKNTPGSGKRFALKFLNKIVDSLKNHEVHSLCKFPEFAEKGWKCFLINDWVVAFEV